MGRPLIYLRQSQQFYNRSELKSTERKEKVHSLIDICRTALEAARRLESHVSSWRERLHGRILH